MNEGKKIINRRTKLICKLLQSEYYTCERKNMIVCAQWSSRRACIV